MSAPDIILLTPNGRFELGKKVGHGTRQTVAGQRTKGIKAVPAAPAQ